MTKVFIDGSAGTTGLRIADRLSARQDIELIKLPEEKRKDIAARKEAINSADIVFLCLPDAAAREAVALAEQLPLSAEQTVEETYEDKVLSHRKDYETARDGAIQSDALIRQYLRS